MDLTKVLKAVAVVNFALAVLFCLFFFVGDRNMDDAGLYLGFTYIQVVIATAATLIFSIAGFVSNPKNAKSVLIGIGGMAFLILLAWIFASDSIPTFLGYEKYNITTGDSKFVGTSLYAIYILIVLGVIGMLGSEIYRFIVKR